MDAESTGRLKLNSLSLVSITMCEWQTNQGWICCRYPCKSSMSLQLLRFDSTERRHENTIAKPCAKCSQVVILLHTIWNTCTTYYEGLFVQRGRVVSTGWTLVDITKCVNSLTVVFVFTPTNLATLILRNSNRGSFGTSKTYVLFSLLK